MKSPPLSKESLRGWLVPVGFSTSAMTHSLRSAMSMMEPVVAEATTGSHLA
jgi:hypothetical protein